MWIKKTVIKRKNKSYSYLQLMKTVYDGKSSKQLVVANLGREDNVNRQLAERLAGSITDDSYLFLDDELLKLLPARLYGETFLLNKVFETTSLRRFLEDLAEFKALPFDCIDALMVLFAYFSFQKGEQKLADFEKKYYLRNAEDLDEASFVNAFRLLRGSPLIHPGISTRYNDLIDSHHLKCYYIFDTKADARLSADGELRVAIMTDEDGAPLFYKRCGKDERPAKRMDCESLCIYENYTPSCMPGEDEQFHFLARIRRSQLSEILSCEEMELVDKMPFEQKYGDVFYGSVKVGKFQITIISPFSSSEGRTSSKEYLITNLSSHPTRFLEWFFRLDEIANVFYNLFLPKDLTSLYDEFSDFTLINILLNVHFMRLFMFNILNVKLEPLNLTADDSFSICRDMKIVPLEYGNRRQLIHSTYSPMQTAILKYLAFN